MAGVILSRLLTAFGVVCLLGAVAHPARAAAEDGLLVLSVTSNGRHHERLTKQLSEFFKLLPGVRPLDGKGLSGAERKCSDPECLYKLAHAQGAALILGVGVEAAQTADCYVSVWLFDTRNGRDRTAEGSCEPAELAARIQELAGSLVGTYRQPAPPVPSLAAPAPAGHAEVTPKIELPSSPPPAVTPREPPTPAMLVPLRRSVGPLRKSLAGTLGTLAGLSLAGAITLNVLSGKTLTMGCTPVFLNDRCRTSYLAPYSASYAVSGALVLGMLLTLTLPGSR